MIAAVAIDTNAYTGFRCGIPSMVEVFTSVPRLIIPHIVVAELLAGFAVGKKADRHREDLGTLLASSRVSIAMPDRHTANAYALIYQQLRQQGHPIPTNDMWIAATVMQLSVPLIALDEHFNFVSGIRASSSLATFLRTSS
jgi:predicted nucleic acid-binding protein